MVTPEKEIEHVQEHLHKLHSLRADTCSPAVLLWAREPFAHDGWVASTDKSDSLIPR